MHKKYSHTKEVNSIFATPLRGAGVVELARLESVYRRNPIKGSNPFPSATKLLKPLPSKGFAIFSNNG
jgi:hypothetical protein